jgi:hypothetical protein
MFSDWCNLSVYRKLFISGITKSIFWKKLKELEAIDKKKSDDKWNKRQDEWNKEEIIEYIENQKIDNEQNELIESDMIFEINQMSKIINNI